MDEPLELHEMSQLESSRNLRPLGIPTTLAAVQAESERYRPEVSKAWDQKFIDCLLSLRPRGNM